MFNFLKKLFIKLFIVCLVFNNFGIYVVFKVFNFDLIFIKFIFLFFIFFIIVFFFILLWLFYRNLKINLFIFFI